VNQENKQHYRILDNDWSLIGADESVVDSQSHIIVPLSMWTTQRDLLNNRQDIAIWLDSDEMPESIASELQVFQFIALNFPSYRDGRAYSSASILRGKLGYEGEIHAIGDVRLDQLEEMARCGFDFMHLQDGSIRKSTDVRYFSHQYQSTADRNLPLYRTENLEPAPK
jgi:uncharacterized protein (DUF934 family)